MDRHRAIPSAHTTPVKPTAECAFIEDLNAKYGLGIEFPPLRLSPRKRREAQTTDAARRADDIRRLTHYLHFRSPETLLAVEQQFQNAAQSICSQWVPKPQAVPGLLPVTDAVPQATTAEERRELQQCLLGLLQQAEHGSTRRRLFVPTSDDPAVPFKGATEKSSSTRPTRRIFRKRLSDELEPHGDNSFTEDGPSDSKRARSALDQVPVRERDPFSRPSRAFNRLGPRGDRLHHNHESSRAPNVIDPVSFNTSYASVATAVFSTTGRVGDDTLVSDSQMTQPFDDDENPSPKPGYISADTAFYIPVDPPSQVEQADAADMTPVAHAQAETAIAWEGVQDSVPGLHRTGTLAQQQNGIPRPSVRHASLTNPPPLNLHSSEMPLRDVPSNTPDELSIISSLTSSYHVDFEPGNPVVGQQSSLDARLRDSWPKLPKSLINAPLPIIWEVTRAAVHCGVELADLDINYNDKWHDQMTFDRELRAHPAFKAASKPFPGMCDHRAWKAAFSSFRHNGRTVTLSMEAKANPDNKGPLFLFSLEPLKFDLGHRLCRRFGADRFLEVIFPAPSTAFKDPDTVDRVNRWLSQVRHDVLSRVWRAFFLKDAKKQIKEDQFNWVRKTYVQQYRVYFFCEGGCNFVERNRHLPIPPKEQANTVNIRTKMSLSHLLEWAIGLSRSKSQKSLKLFSRLALSLTPTTATEVLKKEEIILHEEDLKSPTEHIMNDGIGRMSGTLARKISNTLGLDAMPSGFQGRMGSAKGFWIVDVDTYHEKNGEVWIETYPSQRKWECDFEDEDHRTFEVKSYSRELRSAALNKQFITVLEDRAISRGRMRETLAELLRRAVSEELGAQILAANDPMALQRWASLSPSARADRILHGEVEFLGGLPKSDEEIIKFLLDGGFRVSELKYLRELVYYVAKRRQEKLQEKLKVKVPRSTYAYMVVDFSGLLQENEVHIGFSSSFHSDGESETLLHGIPILVARAPAHFPSDIQKVNAVYKPELRHLTDVIVFPSRGNVPLADLLSGGDYDGDQAWVCWDPDIVNNFQNATVPQQPDLIQDGYLHVDHETFEQTLTRYGNRLEVALSHFLHQSFVFSMQGDLLGQCTNYKEKLCYRTNKIGDESAVLLSTLVSKLVDRAKQGITFTQNDWQGLIKAKRLPGIWALEEPAYMKPVCPGHHDHILDWLKFAVIKPKIAQELRDFEASLGRHANHWDKDLAFYYDELDVLKADSKTYTALLTKLVNDLHNVYSKWDELQGIHQIGYHEKVHKAYQAYVDVKPDMSRLKSSAKTYLFGTDEQAPDSVSRWGLIKASCLFKHYYRKNPKFAFTMAGAQLQKIKAERCAAKNPNTALRPSVSVVADMYACHRPDNKIIDALMARKGMGGYCESLADIHAEHFFDADGNEIDDA